MRGGGDTKWKWTDECTTMGKKKNWKRVVVGGSSSKGRNAMRGEVRRRVERPESGEGEGEGEGEGGEGRRGEPRRSETRSRPLASEEVGLSLTSYGRP